MTHMLWQSGRDGKKRHHPGDPVELFSSSVRSTASAFIFNATRLIAWVFPIIAGTIIQRFGGISRAAPILGSIYVLGLLVP